MDPISLAVDDYTKRKKQYIKKWRSNFEAILRKYDQPYEDDAVIDLSNLKIIHNKGVFHELPSKHIGRTIFASNLRKRTHRLIKDSSPSKPEHESSDSAFDSMGPEDASKDTCQPQHYPALDSLDFTHGDADETGHGCIRYQYDENKDDQPRISGPKGLFDSDLPGSDDEDNISCESESESEEESLSFVDDGCTPLDLDDDDIDEDGQPVNSVKAQSTNKERDMCNKSGSNIDDSVDNEEPSQSVMWSRTDGMTSILEAKENFVRKMHRYFMKSGVGEETGESENDSATTSCSTSGYAPTFKNQGNLFKTPSLFNSVDVSKANKQVRQTSSTHGWKQTDVAQSNLEFNEYSAILASNVDDDDIPSNEADCDADDELQPAETHNSSINLNRTVGGGLKLPPRGTNDIVIGNVPLDTVSDVKVEKQENHPHFQWFNRSPFSSPSSKTKSSIPKTPHTPRPSDAQSPYLSCPKKIIPWTSRSPHTPRTPENRRTAEIQSLLRDQKPNCLHEAKAGTPKTPNSPRTPRSSHTPRTLPRLNSEEMMEIFRSPLPLEITPTKSPGRRYQNMSPTALQSRFDGDLVREFNGNKHSPRSLPHRNVIRESPLAKALKQMKITVEVEQNKMEGWSPRCRTSLKANRTFIVSTESISSDTTNVVHERMEKTLVHCHEGTTDMHNQSTDMSSSTSDSFDESGHHDTFEFQISRIVDPEKLLKLEKKHSLKPLLVGTVGESCQQESSPARLYEMNAVQKCNTVCISKGNKRKLSEEECDNDHSQNASISQIPDNVIQKSAGNMPNKTPNVKRTAKRMKKQSLVTSTPMKKEQCEDVMETVSDSPHKKTPARSRNRGVSDMPPRKGMSDKSPRNSVSDRSPRNTVSNRSSRNSVSNRSSRTSVSDRSSRTIVSDRSSRTSVSDRSSRTSGSDWSSGNSVLHMSGPVKRQKIQGVSSESNKSTQKCPRMMSNILDTSGISRQNVSPNTHRRMPMQVKKKEQALVTSTPIKNGTGKVLKETRKDLEEIEEDELEILMNKPDLNSLVKSKARNSDKESLGKRQSRKRKSNKTLSAKISCGSSKVADQSVGLKSSNTHNDSSTLNSSMSSSYIACEGPGKCTKMFCFSCNSELL